MTLLKHMSISSVLTLTVQPLRQYHPQVELYIQPSGHMHFLKWLHLLPEFVIIMDINAAVLSIAQKRFSVFSPSFFWSNASNICMGLAMETFRMIRSNRCRTWCGPDGGVEFCSQQPNKCSVKQTLIDCCWKRLNRWCHGWTNDRSLFNEECEVLELELFT